MSDIKMEIEELENSLEDIRTWEPKIVGEAIAGMVEMVVPIDRGFLVHLRDKNGQLWNIYGVARDVRDFINANDVEFGDIFGLKYLGSEINQFGIKYRMFSCAVRKN